MYRPMMGYTRAVCARAPSCSATCAHSQTHIRHRRKCESASNNNYYVRYCTLLTTCLLFAQAHEFSLLNKTSHVSLMVANAPLFCVRLCEIVRENVFSCMCICNYLSRYSGVRRYLYVGVCMCPSTCIFWVRALVPVYMHVKLCTHNA